jgi:hypothetical protein
VVVRPKIVESSFPTWIRVTIRFSVKEREGKNIARKRKSRRERKRTLPVEIPGDIELETAGRARLLRWEHLKRAEIMPAAASELGLHKAKLWW